VEVALGEGAAVQQRLQQGVLPPRQRRHAPARCSPGGEWGSGPREGFFSFCGRRNFWLTEDLVGVSREAHGEERGRRQAKQPYAASRAPGKEGNGGPCIWNGQFGNSRKGRNSYKIIHASKQLPYSIPRKYL
jgi:hypothetical protein